jgi:ADP-ribosylglycohydrolase
MTDTLDRAHGALVGLAAGDASGLPAAYHRLIPSPGRRTLLWTQAMELDEHHINKYPLPFSHAAPLAKAGFSATDDSEQAALGAAVLLAALDQRPLGDGSEPTISQLFAAWKQIVLPQAEHYWGSVADKSAILNSLDNLSAPATGSDNPHFYDDSSVARVIPVGIVYSHRPATAATVARSLASITNDGVGVDAAAAMAVAIAVGVSGGTVREGIRRGEQEIAADSWLGRKYRLAEAILASTGSMFRAIPQWNDEVSNLEYNFGNIAAETLPLAFLIARESTSFEEAIGIANLVPKQADTMPAMVGALIGAVEGSSAIPATWRDRVETLHGYTVPSASGVTLRGLAERLLAS